MTNSNTTREAKSDGGGILAQFRKDYDAAYEREKDNIAAAYEDLEFLCGDGLSQWPEKQKREREDEGRPTLQINELPQFVHQITGDIRQMRPSIKVVPVDSGADEKIAELRGGLIRYIENRSDAQAIYFRAADSQVGCGIGHWRVITEYADRSTYNQEIRVAPIEDGVSVLWDPDAVLPTKEDAGFCIVPVDLSHGAFKAKYPEKPLASFDDKAWTHNSAWSTDDYVRVAEYWKKKASKKTIALGLDGSIADVTEAEKSVIDYHRAKGARIEERDSFQLCRYIVSASGILEGPEEWPGRFIPIVPVVGEEYRIGRKLIRNGIVRNAKDAQRMSNYFHSAHTETVALQPKAPFVGTTVNFAKYQDIWNDANTRNLPWLPYEPDSANGGQAPQRVQPPVSSQGVLDGLAMARQDLRSVIGIYDAGLGEKSNETSGKAIMARQREGDVGSFLYIDNFGRAVRQTGNIINDLIPYIYDTERTIRIMGEDGKIDVLEVNKAAGINPETGDTIYDQDITSGSYDVVSTIGPSFSTRREEARDGMVEFVRAAPEAGALILDLLAKAQDWPNADDIAKRLRATLPPKILEIEAAHKQGATPEQIDQMLTQQQEPPPDPKMMAVQAKAEHDQAQLAFQQNELIAKQQEAISKLQADLEKARIQSRTAVEVAQINASVGDHKTIVDAATAQYGAMIDAEVAQAQQERQDATTRYQIDKRSEVDREKTHMAAHTAKYQADNRPEPRAS